MSFDNFGSLDPGDPEPWELPTVFEGFTAVRGGYKRNISEPFTKQTWDAIVVEYCGCICMPKKCKQNHPLTWGDVVELDKGHTWSRCRICGQLVGYEFYGA